jgi:dimethylaniline monooxygenase (N-oxide forming)
VRTYLTRVCQSIGILDRFQFETTVNNIQKLDSGTWTIDVQSKDGEIRTESFDFVIICTGLFSNTPNVLNIPGADEFVEGGGRILHTSQWTSVEEFQNKNVLVIGNGKSAADAAVAAAAVAEKNHTTPPIQAIRKQNWYVPRFLLNFKCLFHSRLVSALLPRYYEESSFLSKVLHTLGYPIKYLLWRALELLFLLLLRLPYKVWPTLGTIDSEGSLSVPLLVTDDRHLVPVRRGTIDLRICEVRQLFATKHALLSTGDTVPVDVLVMGTGWKLDYSFFHKSVLSQLDFTYDGLWLYRNMLAPTVPGMAFIGSNALTFMNIYTAYVQAFWLVGLLTASRAPPSVADMMAGMAREKEFKRRLYPQCALRGATIEAYMQHYHDLLFAEQGISPFLYTGWTGWFWNIFAPILPETMAPSFERVRQAYAAHNKKVIAKVS